MTELIQQFSLTYDGETRILTYEYEAQEFAASYHTLAEVGAPYQQAFRDIIAKSRMKVNYGVELDEEPWVADIYEGDEP